MRSFACLALLLLACAAASEESLSQATSSSESAAESGTTASSVPTEPQKRKTDAASIRERPWTPSNSTHLTYSASRNPLAGIDGIYVINLKRRPDRLETFKQISGLNDDEFHVHEGYDGKKLTSWTQELNLIFTEHNTFGSRKSVIGCALSHFTLWHHIATTVNEQHLIFEDDAKIVENFVDKWNSEYYWGMPLDSDLTYLGGILHVNLESYPYTIKRVNRRFNTHKPTTAFTHDFDAIDGLTQVFGEPRRRYPYTAVAYVLSSEGARILVDMVAKHGFIRPADHMLLKLIDITNKSFTAYPLLVNIPPSKHKEHADDSDIQFDYDVVPGAPAYKPKTPAVAPPKPKKESPQGAKTNALAITSANNAITTALGQTRLVVVVANGTSTTFLPDLKQAIGDAGLNFSQFCTLDAENFPLDGLKEKGVLAKSYSNSVRDAVFDLSFLILFEALAQSGEEFFVVIDSSVQVKRYFLDAIKAIASKVPANWDALFLDCPPECAGENPVKVGVTPVDQSCKNPGAHAVILTNSAAKKISEGALPMEGSWDQHVLHKLNLSGYCIWPKTAVRNQQWYRWSSHVDEL